MVEQFAPEGWPQLEGCLNASRRHSSRKEHIHLSSRPVPSNGLLPHFQLKVLHCPSRSASEIWGWVLHTGGRIASSPGMLMLLFTTMLDERCLGHDRFVLSMISFSCLKCCSYSLTDSSSSPVSRCSSDGPFKQFNPADWVCMNLPRSKSERILG